MADSADVTQAYSTYMAETINDYFYKKLFANNNLCNGNLLYKASITNLLQNDADYGVDLTDDETAQILNYGVSKDVC